MSPTKDDQHLDGSRSLSFSVKNTFIDIETDDIFDDPATERGARRQVSEPARLQRQTSMRPRGDSASRLMGLPESSELSEHEEPEDEPRGGHQNQSRTNQQTSHNFPYASIGGAAGPGATMMEAARFTPSSLGHGHAGRCTDAGPISHGDGFYHEDQMNEVILPDPGPVPEGWVGTTTVMMRNVPNKYSQGMMLTELNETGFLGRYDFFYLPMDPDTSANRGYAFINFVDDASSWLFKITYEGRKMTFFNSSKHVSVTPATLQGFEANYAHYSSARVSRGDPAARPLFLREPTLGSAALAGNQRRGRRRRGNNSAVDIAVEQHKNTAVKSAEQLQQTAAAFASKRQDQNPAALNAIAAAASAAALANSFGAEKPLNPASVAFKPRQAGYNTGGGEGGAPVKFCPYCGGEISINFRFCKFCGANIEQLMGPGDCSKDFHAGVDFVDPQFAVSGSWQSEAFGA